MPKKNVDGTEKWQKLIQMAREKKKLEFEHKEKSKKKKKVEINENAIVSKRFVKTLSNRLLCNSDLIKGF